MVVCCGETAAFGEEARLPDSVAVAELAVPTWPLVVTVTVVLLVENHLRPHSSDGGLS